MGLHVAVVVENVALGVDTRLRKQVRDLLDAGVRVSVVTMHSLDNEPYRHLEGLRVLEYRAPAEPKGQLGYVREYLVSLLQASLLLLRLRARGRIDVLQLCQPPDIYFPLAWVMRLLGARIVVDQRDLMPELALARYGSPPGALMRALAWLERRTQRAADQVICVNEYLERRLVDAGARPDRVWIVRNGPVLSRVEQSASDPSLKGGHRHLVCWAGKMGRQDRVDVAIRVAEHVVRDLGRTDCGFAILGDGECLDELEALTAELGLEEWVSFPGWLPEHVVFSYLKTADLGIDTSLQAEVSPVKALEYMALGLPFVCFDLQESRRIAEGAAVFVPEGDVTALATAVVALLDDEPARRRLGETGRRRVRDELAWERQTPTYLSAIDASAGGSRVASASSSPRRIVP
jgi:glycosyltransferase involved in cell wall biosynthesis